MRRLLHFLRTGHWPKRFRHPHGIPRSTVDWESIRDIPRRPIQVVGLIPIRDYTPPENRA